MKVALLSLLFPLFLGAEIKTSSISSERASYDGNALILKGAVQLEHSLGKMQSGGARLIREGKEGPFSSIYLNQDVCITLKNHGKIHCGKAEFDFQSLMGTLVPKRGESVRFINLHAGPISISSKEAEVEFSKEANSLKVSKVTAENSVQMQYGYDFTLHADKVVYDDEKVPIVTATPHCVLNHYDDTITAERVELFPQEAKVVLYSPVGSLQPSAFSMHHGVAFSCDRLVWEKAPQILTLRGNISITDEGVGTIVCEDEVELRQRHQEGKWTLSSITTKGKTELTYQLDADFEHLLTCYGQMQLDQDRLVLTLDSPPGQPIEYIHDQMQLISDSAQLDYTPEGQRKINPRRLLLHGGVQLAAKNRTRCGIADQFAYYPDEEKMVLCAQNGNNVLFWDEQKQLSISAKEVHLCKTEKGESVKGVGNVRFSFTSPENQLLKQIFPFYKAKGE